MNATHYTYPPRIFLFHSSSWDYMYICICMQYIQMCSQMQHIQMCFPTPYTCISAPYIRIPSNTCDTCISATPRIACNHANSLQPLQIHPRICDPQDCLQPCKPVTTVTNPPPHLQPPGLPATRLGYRDRAQGYIISISLMIAGFSLDSRT